MSDPLVAAPMLVALVTGVLTLAIRGPRWGAAVSFAGTTAYVGTIAALIHRLSADGVLVYQLGDWPAPFGIVLVADQLSAFMLALTAPVALAVSVAAIRQVDRRAQWLSYHSLFHFVLVGVTGAFLTGDIFNLFVWFEVMLMASYVLVVIDGGGLATRATLRYLVLNLVGSAVMLLAIGGLYATTGTLNMAQIASRLGAGTIESAPVLGLSGLLFAVFALKAGAVPFQFWVPGAYRAAPPPVAAMLAGVTKKVGVYAIIRLAFTVLGAAQLGIAPGAYFAPVLFVVTTASVLFGGIAAVRRPTFGGVLAYSSIGQVGFILLPVAIAAGPVGTTTRVLAIAAALIYSLNHALAKALLFIANGAITDAVGTDRLPTLGGLAGRLPVLSGATFVGGLSLVGVPPLSGFFAKLLVFDAATGARAWAVLGVALVGAILTIAYFTSAWNRGFWGQASPTVERASADPVQVGVIIALALAVLAVGVGFDPLFEFAMRGAEAAIDTTGYSEAVLGGDAA